MFRIAIAIVILGVLFCKWKGKVQVKGMKCKKMMRLTALLTFMLVFTMALTGCSGEDDESVRKESADMWGSYSMDELADGGNYWNAVIRDGEYWIYKNNKCMDQGGYVRAEEDYYTCLTVSSFKTERSIDKICLIYDDDIIYYINTDKDLVLRFEKFSSETPLIGEQEGVQP